MLLTIKNVTVANAYQICDIIESVGMRRFMPFYPAKTGSIDLNDEGSFENGVVSMKVVEKLMKKLDKAGFESVFTM